LDPERPSRFASANLRPCWHHKKDPGICNA
jgi:hypothetical protein